jgi:hypothetical protein
MYERLFHTNYIVQVILCKLHYTRDTTMHAGDVEWNTQKHT